MAVHILNSICIEIFKQFPKLNISLVLWNTWFLNGFIPGKTLLKKKKTREPDIWVWKHIWHRQNLDYNERISNNDSIIIWVGLVRYFNARPPHWESGEIWIFLLTFQNRKIIKEIIFLVREDLFFIIYSTYIYIYISILQQWY